MPNNTKLQTYHNDIDFRVYRSEDQDAVWLFPNICVYAYACNLDLQLKRKTFLLRFSGAALEISDSESFAN